MSEACRLRQDEGYGACDAEGPLVLLPGFSRKAGKKKRIPNGVGKKNRLPGRGNISGVPPG